MFIIPKYHISAKFNRFNSISYANTRPTNRVFKNFLLETSIPQRSHSYRSLSLFTILVYLVGDLLLTMDNKIVLLQQTFKLFNIKTCGLNKISEFVLLEYYMDLMVGEQQQTTRQNQQKLVLIRKHIYDLYTPRLIHLWLENALGISGWVCLFGVCVYMHALYIFP